MNKRTILTIIFLSLPLLLLLLLSPSSQQATQENAATQTAGSGGVPKPGEMTTTPVMLPPIETKGPLPDNIQQAMPLPIRPPNSLEEAKDRLRRRLADLEKMSEKEWEADQQKRLAGRQQGMLDGLTPEQRNMLLQKRKEKGLPDLEMPPQEAPNP